MGLRRSAWRDVRDEVHLDPELHDDLDLAYHLGVRHRIGVVSGRHMRVSSRTVQPRRFARCFRRGAGTVFAHWPRTSPRPGGCGCSGAIDAAPTGRSRRHARERRAVSDGPRARAARDELQHPASVRPRHLAARRPLAAAQATPAHVPERHHASPAGRAGGHARPGACGCRTRSARRTAAWAWARDRGRTARARRCSTTGIASRSRTGSRSPSRTPPTSPDPPVGQHHPPHRRHRAAARSRDRCAVHVREYALRRVLGAGAPPVRGLAARSGRDADPPAAVHRGRQRARALGRAGGDVRRRRPRRHLVLSPPPAAPRNGDRSTTTDGPSWGTSHRRDPLKPPMWASAPSGSDPRPTGTQWPSDHTCRSRPVVRLPASATS